MDGEGGERGMEVKAEGGGAGLFIVLVWGVEVEGGKYSVETCKDTCSWIFVYMQWWCCVEFDDVQSNNY